MPNIMTALKAEIARIARKEAKAATDPIRKPYAAFLTHGGGGKAIESIESIAQSFKLKKVAEAVLVKGKPEGQALVDLGTLGARIVAAAGKHGR